MNSGVINNNGTMVFGDTSGTGASLIQGVNASLTFSGTLSTPIFPLTATATGNTVTYSRTGASTLIPTAYHHLILTGASKTMTGVTTIAGNLTQGSISGTTTLITGTTIGGNLIVNGSGGTLRAAASGTLAVTGNTTISAGTFDGNGATLSFGGNFTADAGTLTASAGAYTFTGSGKTIGGALNPIPIKVATITGSYTLGQNVKSVTGGTWAVNNGGTLNCSTFNLSDAGAFTLNSGGTLGIGSPDGITSTASTGNIRVTGTRTYNSGANYTYNGSANQASGNQLPVTVNNLTIANTGSGGNNTVTLGQSCTVSGATTTATTISSGILAVGGNTLTLPAPASGVIGSGGITVGSGGKLSVKLTAADGTLSGLTSLEITSGTLQIDCNSQGLSPTVAPLQINANYSGTPFTSATLLLANYGSPSGGNYPLVSYKSAPSVSGFTTFTGPGSLAVVGNNIDVAVCTPPTVQTVSGTTAICPGSSANITMTGQSGVTYDLYVGGVAQGVQQTGTGGTLTWTVSPTTTKTYTVSSIAAGGYCATAMSASAVVTVNPVPTITLGASPTVDAGSTTANLPYTGTSGSPDQYQILYDGDAHTAGFADVSSWTTLPATPVALTVPGGASVGTYNGTIYVQNSTTGCGSVAYPFTVTLVPTFSAYTITGGASLTAGGSETVTITAVDSGGIIVSGVSGSIALTFSGLNSSPGGTAPTVGGTPLNSPVTLTFAGGQATATLAVYKAESQTLHVADGTHSSSPAGTPAPASLGGAGLALTVSAASDSAYRLTGSGQPQVGVPYPVTVTLVDQYGNMSATSGTMSSAIFNTTPTLSNGADASGATINGALQNVTSSFTLASGQTTVSLVAHTSENGKVITVTDGTLTSAGTGGATLTVSPAAAAASKLAITSAAVSTAAGVASGNITVQRQDLYSNPNTTDATITLTMSSTSGGTVTFNPPSPQIANGSSSVTFTYTDTQAGTPTITAASSGLTSATQQETVTAGIVTQIGWTTLPPANQVYGTVFTTQPVLKTLDQYGNPSTVGLPASLSVTVSGSVPLISGATTSYDLGTASGNGTITGVGLGFQSGSGSPTLTATVLQGYGAPPAGMAIWLDASVPSSVTVSGDQVTGWADQSGNGRNFNTVITGSGGAGNGITYVSTVPNGRPTVTFGATDTTHGKGLINTSYVNSGNPISVFLVTKQTAKTSSQWQKTISATDGTGAASDGAGKFFNFNWDGSNIPQVEKVYGNRLVVSSINPSTEYHVEDYIFTGTGGDNSYKYTTASTTTTGTQVGTMPTVALGVSQFSIGGGFSGAGTALVDFVRGDICELLVYSTDQTANRSTIETYLKNKWMNSTGIYFSSTTATSAGLDVYNFTTTALAISTPVGASAVVSAPKLANHASSDRAAAYPTGLSASASTTANGGLVVINGNGSLTYTPAGAANVNGGTDSFTVTFNDGNRTQTMTVSVTIGTSSTGGQSPNVLTSGTDGSGNFYALFVGMANTTYTVETNSVVSGPTWVKYANYTTGNDGLINVTNVPPVAGSLFFRTLYPSY
jgi:hypothetical protein